ncbi:MAG: DNA glycosylase [Clostridia bacterium]|nr:DNA glycosylase [Clostridia bacterium]
MFHKIREVWKNRECFVVKNAGDIDLYDTLECGQAFRYELICKEEGYVEYMTVVADKIVTVGQRERGELMFFGLSEEELENTVIPYFALDTDFSAISDSVAHSTESEWLKKAAESARGIVILRQDPWETLFSFIISQNNNIPRIRKIIRAMSAEYGENLAVKQGLLHCPLSKVDGAPCEGECRKCGICYSFPSAEAVFKRPEGMLPSKPGFRYKYLLSAAEAVCEGRLDLEEIKSRGSLEYTTERLKEIKGVGDKVASCAALFGFGNLDAFPIDVWMRRAIDEYFDGSLDTKSFGEVAGVVQQYIFHYIRNYENKKEA